jgi:K+-transporting ATPase ATPase C chain
MKLFIQALRLFLVLTLLTGVVYPVVVTAAAQLFFNHQANGSLVMKNGTLAGSELLTQKFQGEGYFWPRPSATDFASLPSGASNWGPTSAALKDAVLKRAEMFRKANNLSKETVLPSDMVFASGSGLDPHISPEAARFQADRVAKARKLSETKRQILNKLIDQYTEIPQFGILGEPRVNVFRLNLAVDSL